MAEQKSGPEEFANEQLDKLIKNPGEISPGHKDATGKLDPAKKGAEIRTKVGQVGMARQLGGNKDKAQRALEEIAENFGKEEVKEVLKETESLKDLSDIFNGEKKINY